MKDDLASIQALPQGFGRVHRQQALLKDPNPVA